VRVDRLFAPLVADAESVAVRWVPLDDVDALPLHPGFAASWPALRERLTLH
jgi:8-oxo-dGTP diphosphatase